MLSQLQTILHNGSQILLYPVFIILILLAAYAVFEVGMLIAESLRERRYFKVDMPRFLHQIKDADVNQTYEAVKGSGLLKSQQQMLLTIFDNRDLDVESRWALAKKLLIAEKSSKQKIAARNVSFSRLAPMIGLMGTLIPLGPGIVAFGNGHSDVMANAMSIAFDTTVAGLVTAALLYLVARIRQRWYAEYSATLEAGVTALLEKIDLMPDEQRLNVQHESEEVPTL